MPAARRCFAVSPAATSGAAASRTAPPRPANSAIPTLSAPTARWAAATPRPMNSPTPSPRNGPAPAQNRYVVLTGGEPLLQVDTPFIDALHARGFEIGIETNGTIEPPDGMDWICVSPKAGADLVVRRGHELKLVYPQAGAQPEDFEASPSSASRCSRWTDRTWSKTPRARSTIACAIRNGGSACRRTRHSVSGKWIRTGSGCGN